MDGMLSQEEINALLGNMDADSTSEEAAPDTVQTSSDISDTDKLTPEESDALGEISNISMGTAATTLSILVNNRVDITTPTVSYTTLEELSAQSEAPVVFIYISYKTGLQGKNLLILKERDVKVITDLMMGGDGTNVDDTELSDLHLSAICEAMNQMMGSAATSMSSMINEMVDISPPTATRVDFGEGLEEAGLADLSGQLFAQVSFRMEIGDLVDSEIMQLYPIEFARLIYQQFVGKTGGDSAENTPASEAVAAEPAEPTPQPVPEPTPTPQPQAQPAAPAPQPQAAPPQNFANPQQQPMAGMQQPMYAVPPQDINIQPAQFQNFAQAPQLDGIAPENIDLIMDVPLEVTVELGRTSKSIKDILDFAPGTIIELDKLAGEPIDVLVNGKFVAKGEVVVIEESFGIRVTEIIKE
ncbi:MAG: flagellar motor switch phosphatase FliY [Clostridium sp.]|nr:flagellar motor switch phosphatase FliY [Clostridium sp.]MDY4875208.1 flagellar motor switch phosphatase FliY [Eubacterium sp.]